MPGPRNVITPNCPQCGARTKRAVGEHDVRDIVGLPRVMVKHLPAFACPNGHGVTFDGKHLEQIMRRLVQIMVQDVDRLGGVEIRFLRKYLGETQEQFAERLGTSRPTLARWEGDPAKEVDATTSFAIRSVVAGALSGRRGFKSLRREPFARRGLDRPAAGYRLDLAA